MIIIESLAQIFHILCFKRVLLENLGDGSVVKVFAMQA